MAIIPEAGQHRGVQQLSAPLDLDLAAVLSLCDIRGSMRWLADEGHRRPHGTQPRTRLHGMNRSLRTDAEPYCRCSPGCKQQRPAQQCCGQTMTADISPCCEC